jgi:hypothetical protein
MSSTSANPTRFHMGDKVVHAARPEWGVGVVSTSSMTEHDGVPCQRLVIRFDNAGLKTLSTAHADIRAATNQVQSVPEKSGPLTAPPPENVALSDDPRKLQAHMTRIPDPAQDPFATPAQRLDATLKSYRYTGTGASLIDWAVMQSGLSDPLSRFARHELEEYFGYFRKALDQHLRKMVGEARDVPREELVRIAQHAPPEGQQALRRMNPKR